jgi:hypothetical protein
MTLTAGAILYREPRANPLYPDDIPRFFIRIERVMPKMVDFVWLQQTMEAVNGDEFLHRFEPAEPVGYAQLQPKQPTPVAPATSFSFGATPVAADAAPPVLRKERMTHESFLATHRNWKVYDRSKPLEYWVHLPVKQVQWQHGGQMNPESDSITLAGVPKIPMAVRDTIGADTFHTWCQDTIGYLPQAVIVRYCGGVSCGARFGQSNICAYLLFREHSDLAFARLAFGNIIVGD